MSVVKTNARGQIKKLEKVISDFEKKAMDFFNESAIARKHNYNLEASLLNEKYQLMDNLCRQIRLKVIEQLINA